MNKLLIGIMMAVLLVGIATPVFAEDGKNSPSVAISEKLNDAKSRAERATNETRENVEAARSQLKETRIDAKEHVKNQKEQIELHRSELKQNLETTRTDRKAELTDKRLELCEQRQAKINELIAASAKVGRERLAHIQQVETKVKDFYERKDLSSSEYDAAVTMINEKETVAVAAVEVAESQKFDCAKVDGDKPSGEIKSLHEAKRTALNDYRDSVKQLIRIVKTAAQTKAGEGDAS